jgi:hypothetical protein
MVARWLHEKRTAQVSCWRVVHTEIDIDDVPVNFRYLEIEVPDALAVEDVDTSALAQSWRVDLLATRRAGDEWVQSSRTALLRVPSVIVPATWLHTPTRWERIGSDTGERSPGSAVRSTPFGGRGRDNYMRGLATIRDMQLAITSPSAIIRRSLPRPNPSATAPHPLPSNQKSMSRSFCVTRVRGAPAPRAFIK